MDSDYDDDDDDIVGEAVYDEEYLKRKKERRKVSSSSEGEGDEEYRWDGDNGDDEEDEDEGDESLNASEEDSDDSPKRFKKLRGRTRRGTKLRSVGESKLGPRRSRRSTRNRIDYKQYEFSDSELEPEPAKPETSDSSDKHSESSEKSGFSMGSSDDSEGEHNNDHDNDIDNDDDDDDNEEMKIEEPMIQEHPKIEQEEQNGTPMKLDSPVEDEFENGATKRRFLDLNELAPGSGFEDGPIKDDDTDNF